MFDAPGINDRTDPGLTHPDDPTLGLQRPDHCPVGHVPRDGRKSEPGIIAHDDQGLGPCRVDATAQAIRLWILAGPEIYSSEITRAICFLQSMQAPSGGMRYQEESDDITPWATLFAVQAVDWYLRDAPCVESLL